MANLPLLLEPDSPDLETEEGLSMPIKGAIQMPRKKKRPKQKNRRHLGLSIAPEIEARLEKLQAHFQAVECGFVSRTAVIGRAISRLFEEIFPAQWIGGQSDE